MGSNEDQTTAFPPHRIIANIYYVGTRTLSAFLIATPRGNILLDSTYERNVPGIRKSIEQLGFKFADTKILLGNHAHGGFAAWVKRNVCVNLAPAQLL